MLPVYTYKLIYGEEPLPFPRKHYILGERGRQLLELFSKDLRYLTMRDKKQFRPYIPPMVRILRYVSKNSRSPYSILHHSKAFSEKSPRSVYFYIDFLLKIQLIELDRETERPTSFSKKARYYRITEKGKKFLKIFHLPKRVARLYGF